MLCGTPLPLCSVLWAAAVEGELSLQPGRLFDNHFLTDPGLAVATGTVQEEGSEQFQLGA